VLKFGAPAAQKPGLQLPMSINTPLNIPSTNVIAAGSLCSTMSDLTLNATDITYDGNETLTSVVALDGVFANRTNVRHTFAESSSTFTVDLSKDDFISLSQNSDITTFDVIQSDPDVATPCIIWRIKDDTTTERNINFSSDVFNWEVEPQLTQFAAGVDCIVIFSARGENRVAVFNDFGV
jgi:hypothetical protein